MQIGDLARATGLSVDTLRYYEKIGLLPRIARDGGGRRIYDADMLRWIEFLQRLKATGMPLADMIAYARLREAGPQTSAARRLILEAHRRAVTAEITALGDSLALLDTKIETYRAVEADLAASGAHESDPNDRSHLPRPQEGPRPARHAQSGSGGGARRRL